EPHERTGDPADEILGVAELVNADLIVVGARGLGAIERFIRGSVSTRIAHHSPCDVLIVEHNA
ncbi:MAG: nucleotide-binding universal stress UspA family protein, partial [Ilumatobacter sp.]